LEGATPWAVTVGNDEWGIIMRDRVSSHWEVQWSSQQENAVGDTVGEECFGSSVGWITLHRIGRPSHPYHPRKTWTSERV